MTTTETERRRPEPRPRRRPSEDEFDYRPPRDERDDWRCWIVSRVNGLNVRRRPSRDSAALGSLDEGDHLYARCEYVEGDEYQSCGGSHYWIPVYFRRRRCYVAWACVDWYTERDSRGASITAEGN
jgi:hypothetical protein